MRFFQTGIQDEWHFVIGGAGADQKEFYQELERQLASQIKALGLRHGYTTAGGLLSRRKMHYTQFGAYRSLVCAEPFGTDLNISWYLYFTRGDASHTGTGFSLMFHDIAGAFTGKSRDRVAAFAAVGRDCAERAVKTILAQHEEPESEQSGQLGEE
jgi:hypothetical protein